MLHRGRENGGDCSVVRACSQSNWLVHVQVQGEKLRRVKLMFLLTAFATEARVLSALRVRWDHGAFVCVAFIEHGVWVARTLQNATKNEHSKHEHNQHTQTGMCSAKSQRMGGVGSDRLGSFVRGAGACRDRGTWLQKPGPRLVAGTTPQQGQLRGETSRRR